MRLSPDATRLAFVAGKGLRPAQPMVTLDLGVRIDTPLEPGHSPRWASSDQIVYGPQEDGALRVAPADRAWVPRAGALPSGNSVTAAAGRVAVHRTDPRRILSTFRAPILGATHPVLSDDGEWLVYQLPDEPREGVSTLLAERADGEGEPRILWTGAPNNVRAAGRSFVWEIGGGQIAGIADAGNPHAAVETFALPAWRIYEPVPVWHTSRGELGLLFLADDGRSGHIRYADWGSLRGGKPVGFVLGVSTGSGYEHDARPLGAGVRTVWFDAAGVPVDGRIDLNAPRAALTPPPQVVTTPPDPPPNGEQDFEFVPNGTVVTGAIETLIGSSPVRQGEIVCLHKNTFPECEWRRLGLTSTQRPALLHWADASRVPGDPGWWIDPAPVWCVDTFTSGESFWMTGQIIDMRPGVPPNRWRQTNTLYGLKGGGVCVQFDPRFPSQYTDMATQGTPQWAPAGYERQWTLNDGRSKWQYIVTPLTAKGVIPWGDRSMDIVIQEVVSGPQPPRAPLPFVPCPRPLVSTPPAPPQKETHMIELSEAKARAGYPVPSNWIEGALMRYRNEVLLERDKIAPDSMSLGALRVFMQHYGATMSGLLVERGVPGGDGWGELSVRAFDAASSEYRRITANPQ